MVAAAAALVVANSTESELYLDAEVRDMVDEADTEPSESSSLEEERLIEEEEEEDSESDAEPESCPVGESCGCCTIPDGGVAVLK